MSNSTNEIQIDEKKTMVFTVTTRDENFFFDLVVKFEDGAEYIPSFQVNIDFYEKSFMFGNIETLTQSQKNIKILDGSTKQEDEVVIVRKGHESEYMDGLYEKLESRKTTYRAFGIHIIDDKNMTFSSAELRVYGSYDPITYMDFYKNLKKKVFEKFTEFEKTDPSGKTSVVISDGPYVRAYPNGLYNKIKRGNDFYLNVLYEDGYDNIFFAFEDSDVRDSNFPSDLVFIANENAKIKGSLFAEVDKKIQKN